MIITLTGLPGAGKTVIGKRLAEILEYEFLSIGQIRRKIAAQRGMTLEEYNKLGETDPSTDLDVDKYQKSLGETKDKIVLDAKIGFHFVPNSVKIFITASDEVRAKRIIGDNSERRLNQTKTESINQQILLNNERVKSDNYRFMKYYNLDYTDVSNFDFILDTSLENDVEKNVEKILHFLKSKNYY